jgi:hypothetical protein
MMITGEGFRPRTLRHSDLVRSLLRRAIAPFRHELIELRLVLGLAQAVPGSPGTRAARPPGRLAGIRFPGRLLDVHETPRAEVLASSPNNGRSASDGTRRLPHRPTNRSEPHRGSRPAALFRRVTLHVIACMHALTNQRFACKPCCHAAKSHTATRALGPRSGPGASEWRYQRTSTG